MILLNTNIRAGQRCKTLANRIIELASRLKFPELLLVGYRKFEDYKDFDNAIMRQPGIGFLAGYGKNGENSLVEKPNPNSGKYIENKCFFEYELADNQKYFRGANKD